MCLVNKRDLVGKIAIDARLTRAQASRALDAFLHGIQTSLVSGDRVTISGFGTFGVTHRKARHVRNPRSGNSMEIAARRVPRFAPGAELKTAVVPQGEKNKYAFVFPIRPGETQFHIVYSLPYSGKLKIDPKSDMPVETLVVAAPESIKFTPAEASLYQNKNNPQFKGMGFFVAKNVTPQQQVAFEIAGSGEMPRETQEAAGGGAGGPGRPENRPGGGLGLPNEMPSPLQSGQWLFLGVLSLFLAAGAIYVYTANQLTGDSGGVSSQSQDPGGMLMNALREEVFQLESERIQGKISPQEYQTAKAALDKTLQRAVQRQSSAKA